MMVDICKGEEKKEISIAEHHEILAEYSWDFFGKRKKHREGPEEKAWVHYQKVKGNL